MKQNKIILSTLLLSSTLLFAGGDIEPGAEVTQIETTTSSYFKSSNFYAGLGMGSLKLKNDFTKEHFKTKSLTFQVGYKINDYLALEGRYIHHVGDVEYDHGTDHRVNESVDIEDYPTDFTNIAIYLKPSYSYEKVTAYALLGYGEVELTNIPLGDVDRAEAGFQWGVGLAYEVNEDFSLFVDYVVLYDDKGFDYRATNSDIKVDALTVGVSYRF